MRPREAKVKNFVAGVVGKVIVITFGGWLYLRLGYADLRANLPPSWLESELATSALNASAARHAPSQPNPIAPTEANLVDGARLYRDKCAETATADLTIR